MMANPSWYFNFWFIFEFYYNFLFELQNRMPRNGIPPHRYIPMYPHGGIYIPPSIPPVKYSWYFLSSTVIVPSYFDINSVVNHQVSLPFSPFPMPSPSGVIEASVSLFKFVFPLPLNPLGKSYIWSNELLIECHLLSAYRLVPLVPWKYTVRHLRERKSCPSKDPTIVRVHY